MSHPAETTRADPARAADAPGGLDAELVVRLRSGDEEAYAQFVRRYQDQLVRFAARLLGDVDEACDVAQETFVRAHERIGQFRGDAALYTWLYRIAYNQAVSQLRKRRVRQLLRLDRTGVETPIPAGDMRLHLVAADDPQGDAERADVLHHVEAAVARLPPRQRSIFVMRHYEGMSHGEIARVLGRSEGAVRAGYFHAVRKLRHAMDAVGLLP